MEIRSMFAKIFGNHEQPQATTQFKMLNSYDNFFAPAPKNSYDDITVRAIINAIATNMAKCKINHIKRDKNGNTTVIKDNLQKMFDCRMNEWMSTYDFIYKIITQLYANNNAFIKIKTNNKGEVIALYPLSYHSIELREHNNNLYLKFYMADKCDTVPYNEIIHLRRFFNNNDILGERDEKSLLQQVNILNSLKQSLESVVKNCSKIRGIIKVNGIFKTSDKTRILSEFHDRLTDKTNQHAILDNSADYQQLSSNLQTSDNEQMSFVQQEIYKYYGVNEKIIHANYNSDEWQAFYQNVIQPLIIQMSQEFTEKIFTTQEKAYGNEIVFSTDRLQYASVQEKINLISIATQPGLLTINEMRTLLGYSPVDNGDERLVSLNYVKETEQSLYQTGKDTNHNGIDDGIEQIEQEEKQKNNNK